MKTSIFAGALLLTFAPIDARAVEAEIQECLCEGMEHNVPLKGGAKADCLSSTHAIEIDPVDLWAEALGQALHYAGETGKRAKVFLYCRSSSNAGNCLLHRRRLESTIAKFQLPVELNYFAADELLAKCTKIEKGLLQENSGKKVQPSHYLPIM